MTSISIDEKRDEGAHSVPAHDFQGSDDTHLARAQANFLLNEENEIRKVDGEPETIQEEDSAEPSPRAAASLVTVHVALGAPEEPLSLVIADLVLS